MYILCRMKELLEDVKPFLTDREVIVDLYSIITTLESMEIFKNLGLLDMKCNGEIIFTQIMSLTYPIKFSRDIFFNNVIYILQIWSEKCLIIGT